MNNVDSNNPHAITAATLKTDGKTLHVDPRNPNAITAVTPIADGQLLHADSRNPNAITAVTPIADGQLLHTDPRNHNAITAASYTKKRSERRSFLNSLAQKLGNTINNIAFYSKRINFHR